MFQYPYYFLSGGLAGVAMGTIGIGAGLITMPLLIFGGMSLKQAVAAIMLMQLLPQSFPGFMNYYNHLLWLPSILAIVGSLVGIWFGSYLVKKNYLTEKFLYRFFTSILLFSALYFFFSHC